jgi:cytochrome c
LRLLAFPLLAAIAFPAMLFPAMARADGDPAKGREIYGRCEGCHSIEANRVGPRHAGLFGRKAGSLTDFEYSDALKKSGIVWNEKTLDTWLKDPNAMVPGNIMAVSLVPDPKDRADVIAFLKTAGAK